MNATTPRRLFGFRSAIALGSLLVALSLAAGAGARGVKVAGFEFVPKDLVFAAAEPKSRVEGEGSLPDECNWTMTADTRVGRKEEGQSCLRYFFKTAVTLRQVCPPPRETQPPRRSERVTATDLKCLDRAGKIAPAPTESRALSSGTTADGRRQDIVVMPDNTRLVVSSDDKSVVVTVSYPDGSSDVLKLP